MKLEHLQPDAAYKEGAYNAIHICLQLRPEEQVTVITDNKAADIAAAMIHEIKEVGAPYRVFVLEDFGARPFDNMPRAILDDLAQSQVSLYAASAQPGELKIRMQMVEVVNRHKIRHAHMVNITREIMLQGMRADFRKIDELSTRLLEKARRAKTIVATSKGGTNITAEFAPSLKWIKTSGIINPDKWSNLPGGEIFTSPVNLNGTFVVDGVVGNHLCQKYGDLEKTPLILEIENARIKDMTCENRALLEDFTRYIERDNNSNRVGEFAIGTNLAVKDIIGNILQDEKIPGIHIAFGHPYSEHTGADWTSSTHIDCVGRNFNIWLDEERIMQDGKFLFEKEPAVLN